jgi:drug/metabolite transporter (DMT)-like permease
VIQPSSSTDRRLLAIGLRLAAVMLFCFMNLLVQLSAKAGVSLPEIMFWRSLFALPVILIWVASSSGLGSLKTRRLGAHTRRSLLGLLGMVCNFATLLLLPLAEATTFAFTIPLFATLLSALLLKEHVGKHRWGAVAVGFLGVLIVAQPGGDAVPLLGALTGLGGAVVVSFVSLQIRDLTKTEGSATIVFYFSLLCALPAGLTLPFVYTPHDHLAWLMLFALGTIGGVAQIFLTQSLRFAPVSTVIAMDYSSLIWATLLGWLVWGHLPPAHIWLGAPIIIASALYIVWREVRLQLDRSRDVVG